MKSIKFLWSGVLVVIVLLSAFYLMNVFYLKGYGISKGVNSANNYESNNNNYGGRWANGVDGYGMMGGNRGMMGGSLGYSSNQSAKEGLSEDKVNKEMEDSSKNAVIDKGKNSITYSGDSVKIVILGGSKQADDKFIIGGLVNPTVYISKNSTVTLELINEDEDVPHGMEFTNAAPPYAYMTMMQGEIYPGSFIGTIPPVINGKFYSDSTTFTANYDGEFYYICEYPSHAAKGMYGKIIIK